MSQQSTVFLGLTLCLALSACGGGSGGGRDAEPAPAQPSEPAQPATFQTETVIAGLDHPWSAVFLPDGRMLVTERPGRLNLIDPATAQRVQVSGVPAVVAVGQGGLLGVALHPRFADNGWVYLSYSAQGSDGVGTQLGRGRLEGNTLTDFQVLFRATPYGASGEHFGGRIVFDGQGYLFLGLGERGERDRAQDLRDHNGKLIRLTADGDIPDDNPFANRSDAQGAIYSYGHRNVQGLAVHPGTGRVWLHEHGPQGGDEINLPEPGRNYGWPIITYGEEYGGGEIGPTHMAGMEQPLYHWTPSIAPSGMLFYTGSAFPAWRGNLFVGALVGRHLARLTLDGTTIVAEEKLLADAGHRIRDVVQGPDGALYLLVDANPAPILRLRPADATGDDASPP